LKKSFYDGVMLRLGLFLAALTLSCVASAQGLIPNASFEQVEGNRPVGWQSRTWAGRANFALSDMAHTGKHSVQITSEAGADASWYVVVPVRPHSTYRLSAWVKTENIVQTTGQGALLNIHSRPERSTAVTGTRDWMRVETLVETGADDQLWINALFGGFGQARGRAWFDDFALELVSTRELKPSATINAASTGEPISKYIYSQFIEHLGRCIYGGIWAEMLEDRKFHDSVGKGESPWKTIGDADIAMDTKGAFVGEHTPSIGVKREGQVTGIQQADLALIKGKSYVGRIWLAGIAPSPPDLRLEKRNGVVERIWDEALGSSARVSVSLVWGDAPNARQTIVIKNAGTEFKKTSLRFTAGATTNTARLEITSSHRGIFRVGAVSLMPADNVRGMRPDTLKLLKELDAPLYRWPGGNFVSGYDWRNGIGDPDKRPPLRNPAWRGIEHNDFGLHEFIDFCREIKTEPLVVVNTGFGDAHSAAQEVEYVNGSANTPMGRLRAQNGSREPFKVVWWGVGNEMFGNWQLGYMSLEHYTLKHNEVAKKMLKTDPTLKLVGVGDAGRWSEGMLRRCADTMDLISEHFYCQEGASVAGHVAQMPRSIKAKADAHRDYRQRLPSLRGKNIRIAMDEWNYWYGPHPYGELGTQYFLKDALGIAAGLHEFYRNSDIIYMANYAQTVNVIGCIKTTKTDACFDTTGLVLQLYRQRYGTLPISVTGAPEPLDVAAAWTPDRKTLTLAVVNPTAERLPLDLTLTGANLSGKGRRYLLTGSSPQAANRPGEAPGVTVKESAVESFGTRVECDPYSVVLYELEVR
jgi:alpha-L-arabinofuranosidase